MDKRAIHDSRPDGLSAPRSTLESHGSLKNPEQEAAKPGGTPSAAVKGSAIPLDPDHEGQQGTTLPKSN